VLFIADNLVTLFFEQGSLIRKHLIFPARPSIVVVYSQHGSLRGGRKDLRVSFLF